VKSLNTGHKKKAKKPAIRKRTGTKTEEKGQDMKRGVFGRVQA